MPEYLYVYVKHDKIYADNIFALKQCIKKCLCCWKVPQICIVPKKTNRCAEHDTSFLCREAGNYVFVLRQGQTDSVLRWPLSLMVSGFSFYRSHHRLLYRVIRQSNLSKHYYGSSLWPSEKNKAQNRKTFRCSCCSLRYMHVKKSFICCWNVVFEHTVNGKKSESKQRASCRE